MDDLASSVIETSPAGRCGAATHTVAN